MTRGAKIRQARKARGWSLAQLASKCGLPKPHLSRLENDEVGIKVVDWLLLRRFLELPRDLPYEGALPLPPSCFRADLPRLKSESQRCWKSRLPALRRAFGEAAVTRHLSLIAALSDRALRHHFLEQVEMDSSWELFLWLCLLAQGAQPAWYSPLGCGFRKHAVVDGGQRQVGDLRRPCLTLKLAGTPTIFFAQVPLRTLRCVYRLDALVCVRRGRQRIWVDLEIDGPAHDTDYDLERQRALDMPTLRLLRKHLAAEDPLDELATALEALLREAA